MVKDERDYTRSASVLIAITLRMLEREVQEEESDEPDSGLRQSVD